MQSLRFLSLTANTSEALEGTIKTIVTQAKKDKEISKKMIKLPSNLTTESAIKNLEKKTTEEEQMKKA